MQSIISLEDLLETIVRILPDLVGVSGCGILLWDDSIEAFLPSASAGFTIEQSDTFNQWVIPKGEFATFDKLIDEKKAVILDPESIKTGFFDADFIILFNGCPIWFEEC
jgi:hypothetical protein